MGLVSRVDEVRSSSKMHGLIVLPKGTYTLLTACDATVNPPGTIVNPFLACFLLVGPISFQHDALKGMGLVAPEHQEDNLNAVSINWDQTPCPLITKGKVGERGAYYSVITGRGKGDSYV
jgi:hypothetical protein